MGRVIHVREVDHHLSAGARRHQKAILTGSKDFLCLITPLCSYLYGGLYGGLYERAHIIRHHLDGLQAQRVLGLPAVPAVPAAVAVPVLVQHRPRAAEPRGEVRRRAHPPDDHPGKVICLQLRGLEFLIHWLHAAPTSSALVN